ncbi:UvrD-helicase domain-containing protein [Flavobacterium pectinovorum]|uniref:DNA 3'-5' helicase n=1 Tax=Flavobacterium pectinovorum TaxID=29533 RepID=A0A502F428_9FLAO|nr:ATP-dependent helicase [Flavobacterium pectinovorum]TPG44152.1 ATP-dependent helicase [Flavobacterium pectinovorum]
MFIWEKGELNSEQEAAIFEEQSTLIIACPGSGKTRTLTYKIAYELARLNSRKQYVIAITYTNAAADEIKDRIELLGVDISQLWIGTIHSFCNEWILRPYSLYVKELKNGFKILNAHDSQKIIEELCKNETNPSITYYDCQFIATIDEYKIANLDTRKHVAIGNVLRQYLKILRQNHQLDYEQILFYSYQILKSRPVICEVLANIFPFIMIDEYQDTKDIQYHIIFSIAKAGKTKTKLFIVGDPNQSIFETLGGYPMNKTKIEALTNLHFVERHLENNYRSSALIIKYFDYFKTFPNVIAAKGKFSDFQSVVTFNYTVNYSLIEDEIARLILYNINENGISPNEICIAAPQWVHLASLTRKLMVRLPDYSFDGPGMAPFARDIDNFWFKLSRIVLTEPSPNMYIRRLRWAREILNELNSAGFGSEEITNKQLLKICNSLNINEEEGISYLVKAFASIMKELNVKISYYPSLQEHYDSFFESSEKRMKMLLDAGNDSVNTISNFRKVFKQREGIKVSTIHGVKGTEYDTIIGFGLLQNWVPHFQDVNGIVNSKKMLYVLASRARKHLHLISESGRQINRYNPHGLLPTSHLIEYEFDYNDEQI